MVGRNDWRDSSHLRLGGKQKQALTFAAKQQRQTFTLGSFLNSENSGSERLGSKVTDTKGEEIMRRYRLSICLTVLGLSIGLGYSTSQAQGIPGACAVGVNVHHGARILLNHHTIAQCTGPGCKCVSCYNLNGSVSAVCYPLVAPIPGAPR